jgi:putative PIN family toxin of toxin-antitoxin system
MRLVLDTNVLIAAFRSRRGASAELLRLGEKGLFRILCSTALFLEYEAVLSRAEVRRHTGHTLADVAKILDGLAALAIGVDVEFRMRPTLRDPNDEMVLEAALNGGAEAIVTHNERDFAPAKAWKLQVLRPAVVVRRLKDG